MMMFDRLQSLTLLSPVDGLDPFGLVPIYCITPGEMLNFRYFLILSISIAVIVDFFQCY